MLAIVLLVAYPYPHELRPVKSGQNVCVCSVLLQLHCACNAGYFLEISRHLIIVLLQGQHLQRGSRLVDFDIRIGDAACVPVSLTDNQVDCRPPTNIPNRNVNNTFCLDGTLSTDVCIYMLFTTMLFLS